MSVGDYWQISLGNGAISGHRNWSLLSSGWLVSISWCQISLIEWKSMLWSLCVTSTHATVVNLSCSSLTMNSGGFGKKMTSTEWFILSTSSENSHGTHSVFTQRNPSNTSSQSILFISFPIAFLLIPDHPAKSFPVSVDCYSSVPWSLISSFR